MGVGLVLGIFLVFVVSNGFLFHIHNSLKDARAINILTGTCSPVWNGLYSLAIKLSGGDFTKRV
jgi:hypothetical protein